MKFLLFAFSIILLSSQIDYHNMDLLDPSASIEMEENNPLIEEYTFSNSDVKQDSNFIPVKLKVKKVYLLTFNKIHLDQEIDPPDFLS